MGAALEKLLLMPKNERTRVIRSMTSTQILKLQYEWEFWARDNQLAPSGNWNTWLILAGRGFGKTRAGCEWVRQQVEAGVQRIAIVCPTAADCRDVAVEGDSGLLAISPPWNMPTYEPSKRRITWPNGATATLFSAETPSRLRGPQFEKAWVDELVSSKYPEETWDMLQMGLRLGDNPQVIVTTTPKPIKLLKEIMKDPMTVISRGKTYDNMDNLAKAYIETVIRRYEGTTLGRQELNAELIEDVEGALWTRRLIEENRVREAPELVRVVVGVDPSATTKGDEAGVVVAGLGADGNAYVLDDLSIQGSPDTWGREAVAAYHKHKADRLVAEANNGGEMVQFLIKTIDPGVSYKQVHASRGKATRAEPIVALYEQGKVRHVGAFPKMEDEMCFWVPGEDSPNRMDALVWALTELMLGKKTPQMEIPTAISRVSPWV